MGSEPLANVVCCSRSIHKCSTSDKELTRTSWLSPFNLIAIYTCTRRVQLTDQQPAADWPRLTSDTALAHYKHGDTAPCPAIAAP